MRLFVTLLLMFALNGSAVAGSEIRILIDVSGSMKQNDPKNLRIPALKLLLELLPEDSRAGVWLFAEATEPLIAVDAASPQWKQKALGAITKIHSRGRFTHIENALTTVTADWLTDKQDTSHNVILLTDGMVDVSSNPALDEASKARIEQQLIPTLQQQGVHLYTIALSNLADHDLLKRLALATDGWNETADSAEQLQRLFVKLFKKAVPQDGLPLENNTFTVDVSVREFTLLAFRSADASPTELVKPDGSHWSYDQHPESVRWRHEDSYDLITVSQPMPGQWQLIAKVDPDNQVMIVTDLKLKVAPLPHYLSSGESLTIKAELTEHDKRITRDNFLKLVRFQLQQNGSQESPWSLAQDPDQPGVFAKTLTQELAPGTYELTLTADGKTFQRQWTQSVEMITAPVTAEVVITEAAATPVEIRLTPDPKIIDPASFQAQALIADDQGNRLNVAFSPTPDGLWVVKMKKPPADQPQVVNFEIRAQSVNGHPLSPQLKPVTIDQSLFQPVPEMEKPVPQKADSEEALLEELETEPSETNWLLTGLLATAINLGVGIGGFFLWRNANNRAREQQEKLLSRLTA